MTEITVRGDGPSAFAPTPPEAIHAALEQWVGGMAASVRGAEYMVDTPMCPDSFWPLPAGTKSKAPKQMLPNEDRESFMARRQVATYTLGAVVRYGLQLGLPPEVAVQGIFTVGGRMSMYAEQMVALVKSRGHGHRVVERTRERCTIEVRRQGETEWVQFTYTIDDAIAAGHVPGKGPNANLGTWPDGKPKTGGNEKYLSDPAAMLYARVSSIGCRTEFPDVLRGLVSYEEVQDERRAEPVEVTVEPAARVTAASILAGSGSTGQPGAKAAAQVIAEAAAPTEVDAPPEPEVTRAVLPASATILEVIRALFEVHGIAGRSNKDKANRLAVFSAALGREITAPPELTDDEARMVRDNLMGESGKRLVAEALGREYPPAEDQDPTTDPSWGTDGGEPA